MASASGKIPTFWRHKLPSSVAVTSLFSPSRSSIVIWAKWLPDCGPLAMGPCPLPCLPTLVMIPFKSEVASSDRFSSTSARASLPACSKRPAISAVRSTGVPAGMVNLQVKKSLSTFGNRVNLIQPACHIPTVTSNMAIPSATVA